MGGRRVRRVLCWLATVLAVALTAGCIPPPEDPPETTTTTTSTSLPPGQVPINIDIQTLFAPVPGTLTVNETTTHVVGLTELPPGDLASQCMPLGGSEQLCLGNTTDPTFVVQSEATTDRFLKGGDAVAALQWMVEEGAQAIGALNDLPADARVERFARPEIRSYMVTRLLDILDKAAYGKSLTADEQRALEFLQQQILKEDRTLTRAAYEEHQRYEALGCGYAPPPAPAFVESPLGMPPGWHTWCLSSNSFSAVFAPPMPSVEHFQTWAMYRAASELGLQKLTEPQMQAILSGAARAGTFLGGTLAAAGAAALTTKLVGLSTTLAEGIAAAIHPFAHLTTGAAATLGAASAGALVGALVLSLVSIGVAVWQLVERDQIGATLVERMNAAWTSTDPFGLEGLAAQHQGRDLEADRESWTEGTLPRYRTADSVARLTELVTRWSVVRPNGQIAPDPSELWPSNATTASDVRFRVRTGDGPETTVNQIQVPVEGGTTNSVRFNDGWAIVGRGGQESPALTFSFVDADGNTRLASRYSAPDGTQKFLVIDPAVGGTSAEHVDSISFRNAQNEVVTARLLGAPTTTPLAVRPGVAGRLLPGVTLKLSPNPVDDHGFNRAPFIEDHTYEWTVQRFDEATGQWVDQTSVSPAPHGGNPTYGAYFTPATSGRHRAVVRMRHVDGAVADVTGLVEFTVAPPAITVRNVSLQDDHLDDELRLSFQVLEDGTGDELDVEVQWPGELGSDEPGPVSTLTDVACTGSFPCATTTLSVSRPTSRMTDLRGEVTLTVTNSHGGAVTTAVPIDTTARPRFTAPPVEPGPDQVGTVTFNGYVTHLEVPVISPDAQPNYVVAGITPGADSDPDPTFVLVDPTNGQTRPAIDVRGDGRLLVNVGERGGQPVIVARSVLGLHEMGSHEVHVRVRQSNGAEATLVLSIDVVAAPGDRFRAGISGDIDPLDMARDDLPELELSMLGGRVEWGDYDGELCVGITSNWASRSHCDHVSAFLNPDGTSKPFPFHQVWPGGFEPGDGVYRARAWLPDSDRSWSEPTEVSWMMLSGSGQPSIDDLRWEPGPGRAVIEVTPRSVSAPITSITCRVDGGAEQSCFLLSGGTWSPPGLSPGTHELWVLVTDAKGNYTTSTLEFTT